MENVKTAFGLVPEEIGLRFRYTILEIVRD